MVRKTRKTVEWLTLSSSIFLPPGPETLSSARRMVHEGSMVKRRLLMTAHCSWACFHVCETYRCASRPYSAMGGGSVTIVPSSTKVRPSSPSCVEISPTPRPTATTSSMATTQLEMTSATPTESSGSRSKKSVAVM